MSPLQSPARPHERLAYDDADTTAQMHADCAAVAQRMHLATPADWWAETD